MAPTYDIHSDAYRPGNVRLEGNATDGWTIVDFDGTPLSWRQDRPSAVARLNQRRGVIKAALTRRANKALAECEAARAAACTAAGVTWAWLRETMSDIEADAWLGID